MAKRPLLIFPANARASKSKLNGGPIPGPILPAHDVQVQRLTQKVSQLDRVLQNGTAYLANHPGNFVPEMILVFEIAGSIDDFFRAVEITSGLEFLLEQRSEFQPDNYFATPDSHGRRTDKNVESRLFLTMTNQQAIAELVRYWNQYQNEEEFAHGTGRFANLFKQLRDVRPYGVQDRVRDTGILEDIQDLKGNRVEELHFEIELAFKQTNAENILAFQEVAFLLNQNDGRVIQDSRVIIPEIRYHAFIAVAPIASFDEISENTNISFLKSQKILFFRPVGQSIAPRFLDDRQDYVPANPKGDRPINEVPIVALFDGYPLANHVLLQNRLIIDDPDGFGNNYLAANRRHGTAMASLIIHGDLSDESRSAYDRRIYVRPMMVPAPSGDERLPLERLPVDLVHRAVKRMFEGDGEEPPVAPEVKIINFSIGDAYRPFNLNISTWAKLIDWLSYKYNVLFLVSAGNLPVGIDLDLEIPNREFDNLPLIEKQRLLHRLVVSESFQRKILTPAEAINALTIGASHEDSFAWEPTVHRLDLYRHHNSPSHLSRIGFGVNMSVKPEIYLPGGRGLFRRGLIHPEPDKTRLRVENYNGLVGPGVQAAAPGQNGETDATQFSCGSSNATALATRLGAQLLEMLIELNQSAAAAGQLSIDTEYLALMVKSLLVHGASHGQVKELFSGILAQVPGVGRNIKKHVASYMGFGAVDAERILYCTDKRVTLLGFGRLSFDQGHVYGFPLPPSIGQHIIDKKLTITLAWFSPLNFKSSKYRQAHLYFDNVDRNGLLALDRQDYDFKASQKGTVQHDILTGHYADAFIDGSELRIKVNCRDDASGASRRTLFRYALCVTLEVNENQPVEIYQEVRDRIRLRAERQRV